MGGFGPTAGPALTTTPVVQEQARVLAAENGSAALMAIIDLWERRVQCSFRATGHRLIPCEQRRLCKATIVRW